MGREIHTVEKVCLNCDNKFTIHSNYKRKLMAKFCCSICARSYNGKLNKGKKHTPEWRRDLSAKNSGVNNPFYGRKHTEETKKKIGLNNKYRIPPNKGKKCPQMAGDNNPSKRPEVRALISKRVKETHWNVK